MERPGPEPAALSRLDRTVSSSAYGALHMPHHLRGCEPKHALSLRANSSVNAETKTSVTNEVLAGKPTNLGNEHTHVGAAQTPTAPTTLCSGARMPRPTTLEIPHQPARMRPKNTPNQFNRPTGVRSRRQLNAGIGPALKLLSKLAHTWTLSTPLWTFIRGKPTESSYAEDKERWVGSSCAAQRVASLRCGGLPADRCSITKVLVSAMSEGLAVGGQRSGPVELRAGSRVPSQARRRLGRDERTALRSSVTAAPGHAAHVQDSVRHRHKHRPSSLLSVAR
jgi:hypothetical protein